MVRRLAILVLCAFLQAGETPETAAEIRALIRDLASPNYVIRARAHGELLRREKDAAPFLHEALEHKDPEIRRRARRIWRVPSWGWPMPRTTYEPHTRMPREVLDRATCIRLVLVPPGEFYMGAKREASAWPRQRVRISRAFYLGRCEVTQDEWNRVMNPKAPAAENTQRPKTGLAFDDIERFCNRTRFRLPTEAEWEFAARAGTKGEAYGELDRIAWHFYNSLGFAHRGATKHPNAFGLFDMLGNVREVCAGFHGRARWPAAVQVVVDPPPLRRGFWRLVRGGSFNYTTLHVAGRSRFPPSPAHDVGFRVARDP